MQQKRAFETFNDGIINIFSLDDEGDKGELIAKLRFGNQIIGSKRFYEAKTAKVDISKLIRIPLCEKIEAQEVIAVIDKENYKVKQVQHIYNSQPKKTVLTLQRTRQVRRDG